MAVFAPILCLASISDLSLVAKPLVPYRGCPRKENHVVSLATTNMGSFWSEALFREWRLKGARAQLQVQRIRRTGYMSSGDIADVMCIQV